MKSKIAVLGLVVSTGLLAGQSAWASSDDAWLVFQKEIATRCKAAVSEETGVKTWRTEVSVYGSESFGLAILTTPPKTKAPMKYVCVMAKQTKTIEVYGGDANSWASQ